MEEVSVKLIGGLGNYLFQIAAALSYSKKYNKKLVLTTDDSIVIHKHIDIYKHNILNSVELIQNKDFGDFKMFNENGFNYKEIPEIPGNIYLNGYFQSEKYFKGYSEEIRKLFSYPQDYIDAIKEKYKYQLSENTCSIHVRRGDYLNLPNHHPVQNMNYYMKSIKQMPKDSMFLIFSDDISWCKQNFPDLPEKFKFIEGNNDHEDLLLQSLCKNNIIANSTFSWWAAWLNANVDKKIIIPKEWFGSANSHFNIDDLYCENWIKL